MYQTVRCDKHSFIHLFCKKQLTERKCTIKLNNWLKYNSSNIQLQIKLQVQIGLTVNVNDLLRMLTGKKAIVRKEQKRNGKTEKLYIMQNAK